MNKIRVIRRRDGFYYGICFDGERTCGFLTTKRARHVAAELTLNDKRLRIFGKVEFQERKHRQYRVSEEAIRWAGKNR